MFDRGFACTVLIIWMIEIIERIGRMRLVPVPGFPA